MKTTPLPSTKKSEVAIFERLLSNGTGDLSPELARYLLALGFGQEDKARMSELAARNQDGALSPEEVEELHSYAKAGCLLGIFQSRARQALKRAAKGTAS
jgi:hypothetical protein